MARQTDDEMTGYVATRWYRAPEIMLNWMHYNQTGKTFVRRQNCARFGQTRKISNPQTVKRICRNFNFVQLMFGQSVVLWQN